MLYDYFTFRPAARPLEAVGKREWHREKRQQVWISVATFSNPNLTTLELLQWRRTKVDLCSYDVKMIKNIQIFRRLTEPGHQEEGNKYLVIR